MQSKVEDVGSRVDLNADRLQPMPRRLKVALVLTSIVIAWSLAFYIICVATSYIPPQAKSLDPGQLATVLFGASTLMIAVFTILISVAGLLGWERLKQSMADDFLVRLSTLERDFKGRVHSIVGMMIGTLHSDPESLDQDKHKDYLSEAVEYCQLGFDTLSGVEGNGKYMALNNLIYYSCLYGDRLRKDFILAGAQKIKELGMKTPATVADYLLTYCLAAVHFEAAEERLREALDIAKALEARRGLNSRQAREAAFYAKILAEKLEQL